MLFQKSNETELKTAWDCYMDANDRWKLKEAQNQAKAEIKVCTLKYAHYIASPNANILLFVLTFIILIHAEWPFEAY